MNEQTLYKETKEIIEKHKFYIKKSYGQNFLIDPHVISKIIDGAEIEENDLIIEIGPGLGTLTRALAKKCKKIICIEIDKTIIPILEDTLNGYNNVEIINQDILKVDIKSLLAKNADYKNIKVVANLPYYISTNIIMTFLELTPKIQSLTVMMQKEVASRLKALPKTKDYGSLTIALNYYGTPHLVANVPKNCFLPRPNVDSTVLNLKIHKEWPYDIKPLDESFMFKIIRASFAYRRKTLVNCLADIGYKKDYTIDILSKLDINQKARGEELSLLEYIKLSNII